MGAYEAFASVYDTFMDNVDYEKWSRYLIRLLRRYGADSGIICELGCGTGSMTERLADAGYDMIGIDSSPEMLDAAVEKKLASGSNILYLEQDMRAFELYGTVRAIVSVCDSMNYLLTEDDLRKVFRLANNYLDPGGVFIFDMNMAAKYEEIGDATIAENRPEGSFIWENSWDPERLLNTYELTLFIPERETDRQSHGGGEMSPAESDAEEDPEEGTPCRRYHEEHMQRAYSVETVRRLIGEAGMTCEAVYGAFTDEAPAPDAGRVYFVAREHGKKGHV